MPASILIVDDNPANLLAVEAVLEPLGHRLVRANSGSEALMRVLDEDFAAILLDVQMPGLDGYETASLIKQRERSRHIPIIFLTAINREPSQVFRGYAHGAVDYLLKPFDAGILRSKVSVFVELFHRGEQIERQAALLRKHELEAMERRSQLRFRTLTDSMPQCVWAMSADGRIYYANRVWLALAGPSTPAPSLSEAGLLSIHPDERARFSAAWRQALESGHPFEMQYRLRRESDGVYRWHLGRAVPERDETGALCGWIATATDIHDQKTIEEKLETLAAELREAVSARDQFLSVASHELRTPLTSLQLTVQRLLRSLTRSAAQDPEAVLAKLRTVEQQVRRQVSLVEKLLDVSRISSGQLQLELEPVDAALVTREVAARFDDELSNAGCTVQVVAEAPVIGRWDRMRLDQVVTNLLSNAVKYGPGKPIEIRVQSAGDKAKITVIDQGIGIADEDQRRLFQRFVRVVADRNYSGFGLGLWISRRIVEALGGKIDVRSEPGRGSAFVVELPLEGPSEAPVEDGLSQADRLKRRA
jgi:PAS domain S-box-containing protein